MACDRFLADTKNYKIQQAQRVAFPRAGWRRETTQSQSKVWHLPSVANNERIIQNQY
jgi:hypothetical protein